MFGLRPLGTLSLKHAAVVLSANTNQLPALGDKRFAQIQIALFGLISAGVERLDRQVQRQKHGLLLQLH